MEAEPDLVDGSVGIRFGPNPAPASVRCARQPNKFVAAATARLRSVPPPAVTDQPAPTPIRQLLRSIYSDKLAHQLPRQARKTPQASIMFCFVIDSSRSASGPST
jgi:hypothetical protein